MSNKLHNLCAETVIREVLRDVGVEPLNEMALNEMSPKVNYKKGDPIHIRYDHEGQTTYYFKVYKEKGIDNITEMSRISLIKPKYEPPHDDTPPLVLRNWEVDWLIEKLGSKPDKTDVKEKTLLEYIINKLNKHNKGLNNGFIIQSNIKPSDYEALKGTKPPKRK